MKTIISGMNKKALESERLLVGFLLPDCSPEDVYPQVQPLFKNK